MDDAQGTAALGRSGSADRPASGGSRRSGGRPEADDDAIQEGAGMEEPEADDTDVPRASSHGSGEFRLDFLQTFLFKRLKCELLQFRYLFWL